MINKKLLSSLAILLLCALLSSCSPYVPSQSTDANDTVPDSSAPDVQVRDPEKYNIPVEGDYVLLYEEEFDSPLDLSRWRYRTDEKGGGKNLAQNVSVSDGRLNIRFENKNNTLTGGGVITRELFGYGYYETKCTLFAEGGGLHSAFWLMGGSGNGITLPKQNNVFELDGFEFDSHKPNTISFNLNYKIGRAYGLISKYTVPSLSGREAVFGFEWLPDRINWYMDGTLMHTVTQDTEPLHYAQQALWLTALANDTMSGSIDTSLLPAYSSFDYFRYYAKPLKGVNLIGSSGFEYNDNVGFESSVDMQSPLSFCEKGNVGASLIEMSADAYAGNCMLVHKSPDSKSFETYTYQKLYNIPNAAYTLSVAVKASGTPAEICRVEITEHGGEPVSFDIKATDKWQIFTLEGIRVSTNTAKVHLHTKGDADSVVCIDELSFASSEGESTAEAMPYPNRYIGESAVGEIIVNGKSASFVTSEGWKKSSVIGDEYASWYKLSATPDDYVSWTETAPVTGEYDLGVYNVESGGKVQRQKVSIYSGGSCIFTHDTGADPGWQNLGRVTLSEGESYVIRIENTPQNKTMRADSVRLTPVSTVSYSDCIIMHTDRACAYVYGTRTNINNIPSPVREGDAVYLPRAFVEASAAVTLSGECKDIGGVEYINASALGAASLRCELSDDGIVFICPSDISPSTDVISAAALLFP